MLLNQNIGRKSKAAILFFIALFISSVFFPVNCYSDTKTSVIKTAVKKVLSPFSKTSKVTKSGKRAIGKTIGGNSAILRARLFTKPGYEAHHLIPVSLKNHPILNKISMDMDEIKNGISLPTYPGLDPKLPLHRGNHPDYTRAVKDALDKIPDNLSVKETKKRVVAVQTHFRKKLEKGTPLHTSQGGSW